MRLAQIARKVGMTPQEVRRFLEKEFELNIGNEPNYKLDDSQVNAVLLKFPIPEVQGVSEVQENPIKPIEKPIGNKLSPVVEETETVIDSIEEEIQIQEQETVVLAEIEDEIQEISSEITSEVEEIETSVELKEEVLEVLPEREMNTSSAPSKTVKIVEIDYEREERERSESQSFQEVPVDPNAELIKAPTVKLDGLKILGKIELPELNKVEPEVSVEELEAQESDRIAELDAAMQSQVQDIKPTAKVETVKPKKPAVQNEQIDDSEAFSIYKDKHGNYRFTLEQKANRAKSLAESNERKKLEVDKEKKKRHYEKIAAQRKEALNNTSSKKEKSKKVVAREQKRQEQQKPKPTTLWGKFVYWLND